MDETIRSILQEALNGDKKEENLMNAYSKLKRGQQPSDQSNPFAADVYVICAETAYQLKKFELAEDCLKMYFQKAESGNECLGRAYICQAQLNQPESSRFPDQLEKCASFLLKAINFGKGNKKHHYLVYNASVLYWSFARPFLKPNCQHLLAKTLHQVVKALDDTDDKDYHWRAELMISLIECYLDGGKKEDASQVSIAAASFTKAYCPQMYKMVLSLQMQHKLIDLSKLLKDSKQSTDIAIYMRILKLKSLIESNERVDVDAEIDRLYRTIINDGIEPQGTGRSTRMSQMTPIGPISHTEKSSLLLDLIKLCLEYEKVALAEEYVPSTIAATKDPAVALEIEFLKSEITAQQLKGKRSQYTRGNVETRMIAIRKLEDSLTSAIRLDIPTLIQVGCVAMWNLCLPLLQKDFRKAIKAPLSLVAVALEDIDSLLLLLRCQIHIELAKCEEDNEQLESAMNHLLKALELDDTGIYKNRIEGSFHRLKLRSMLYQLPERPEDIAALIIEQARTTKEAGKLQMKRAALVKAGLALAPDTFGLVMDGESGLTLARNGQSNQQQLGEKVSRYRKSMSIINGHIQRLGNENDRERAQIWADLVKTARKQNIWDVTRVAAKFCLLYDDGRWEGTEKEANSKDDSKGTPHTTNGNNSHSEPAFGKRSVTEIDKQSQDDTDLLQVITEVHFIHAEALIQLLQSEGVQLFENPSPIEDLSTKPKSREGRVKSIEETQEWNTYSQWIQSLCESAVGGFHRGAKLGAQLGIPWLISNAGIYLWNYVNHILTTGDFARLIKVFRPVYDDLKVLGYLEDIGFFCEFVHALACGYMQHHLPTVRQSTPVSVEKDKKGRGGKHSSSPTQSKSRGVVPLNDPDAISELKQALEILEHALNLTNGSDVRCIVPIANRQPIIKTWVLCRLLTGQLLPKNLGHDDENPDSQGPMSKALCAIEAHILQQKYGFDITNCPGLFEIIKLVENCKWTDRLVEIETWTHLASLAAKSQLCQIVIQCGERALELGKSSMPANFDKLSDPMKHQCILEKELLYYSSVLMGENVVAVSHGRNESRRKALGHFYNACRFAAHARNYELTLNAAQRYWNTCQHFILSPLERKLLKEPIKGILNCITEVWKYSPLMNDGEYDANDKEHSEKVGNTPKKKSRSARKSPEKGIKSAKNSSKQVRIGNEALHEHVESSESQLDSHLALRAALYGVLFQAYADMNEWKSGLKAMDEAVKVMPRTQHRLLIFKHRVIVNARLGNPVQFDMRKFKDTDELLLSSMWHRIAKNSNDPKEQLVAFQNSIECLEESSTRLFKQLRPFSTGLLRPRKDPKSKWQKVDYIAEFAEWLFINEFPVQDCLDHLEIAMELIIDGIKSENLLVPSSAKQHCENADERKDLDMRTLINSCFDIRSIEMLARLHVMFAQILETSSQESEKHILAAAYCVQKIWQNSIRNAEKAIRSGLKPGERPFSRSESKRREGNKQDKQGTKSCFPSNLDQWVNFTLPEKLKEYFQNDAHGYFISKQSLTKPELTIHYLDVLSELLRRHGHHLFVLPVCALLFYIANDVLNDKFLIILSRLQLLDILNDVQMRTGVSNILKSLSCKYLTEEDKAESREKILLWREKQAQVKIAQTKQETEGDTVTTADSRRVEFCTNKKLIRGITNRETWTKIAGLLIRQGQFNDARELLEEAEQSAEAFEDSSCLAHIQFNYALIAYHECDWGAAVSHLENIQDLEESLYFWLKVILLKVDAYQRSFALATTFHSHPEAESTDQATLLLNSSIDTIKGLFRKSPNRFSNGKYVIAALETCLADYLLKTKKSFDEETMIQISELLESSFKTYKDLGFRRDALKVIRQKICLYQMRALSSTGESRRESLMKCYMLSQEAVSVAQETIGIVTLPKNETGGICLPIEEELTDALLMKISICLEILNEMTSEKKEKVEISTKKERIDVLLDEYVAATPVYTKRQTEWNAITSVVAEEALSVLTLVFSSFEKFPKQQARASLYLGKCLHQIAIQRFPGLREYDASEVKDIPDQHPEVNLSTKPEIEATPKESLENETKVNGLDNDRIGPRKVRQKERDETIKQKYADYSLFITQAIEYLLVASQIALRNGFKDIIAKSSYALVECIGNRDPLVSAQYLALFQSANSAIAIGEIAQRLFLDPHFSRVGGMTQQRRSLNEYAPVTNESIGVRGFNLEILQTESEAWRRLHVTRNHLDIVKDLPFPMTSIVLQHSPDKMSLYAAILERPKSNLQVGKKKDASTSAGSRSRICSTKVSKELLHDLKGLAEQFKMDVASLLLRKRYIKQQAEKRREMLGLSEKAPKSVEKATSEFETAAEEKRLQSNFEDLVGAMEGYFGRIISHIQESLLLEPVADTVVILADSDLLQLPLEALPVFRHSEIKSVTRDLSLQILSHRITQGEILDQQNGKLEKGKLGKKDKVEIKSKPEKTGPNNKKGKATKELVFGKEGVQLDISNLRYIVDPRCDWSTEDQHGPDNDMAELILQLKHKTAKWIGLNGHERIPSIPELQKFIQDSPSLIFYGFERFFAHVPPQSVAPLCLTDCHLIALMDNMRTLKSSFRQGKLDAQKCPTDLALECPLETTITLSLCGAPCILSNQWQCEIGDNRLRLHAVIEGLCETVVTVGQALHASRRPKVMRNAEQVEREGAESRSEKAGSSQGKHKTDSKHQKLQHKTSRPESMRSSKLSSTASTPHSKREVKQKLATALKEVDEQKRLHDQGKTEEELAEDCHEVAVPYERYNMVLYGLPNFITAPQSGN